MIEEFSFGNFNSFKDVQNLNMTAAKIRSKNVALDELNVFSIAEEKGTSLLKSKAIYGANASGKSNIIKALVTFIRIIRNSAKDDKTLDLIDSHRLSTETINEPTFFQMVFRVEGIRYRYGFEADNKCIKSEWLFSNPNKREQPLFIRELNEVVEINKTHFHEGVLYQKLFENSEDPIFTENSLLLTHLSSTGFGKISKRIIKAIGDISIISGLGHMGMYGLAGNALNDGDKKRFILEFLKKADTGIDDLETIEVDNEEFGAVIGGETNKDVQRKKVVISSRAQYNASLEVAGTSDFSFIRQESEGTRKMFELSPFMYRSLKEGTPLVIDEFDARFHPMVTRKIIELYNSAENKNAQLIFVTHDTNLLSSQLLRRDQIDFVEKDRFGASHLYTLVELKGIRNNASFEKDYIHGKYGAIPFLGDFTHLLNVE